MSREQDHGKVVARLITDLCENKSMVHITGVLEQNTELQEENQNLKTANNLYDRKIAQYVGQHDAMKSQFDAKNSELHGLHKEKNALLNQQSLLNSKHNLATRELIEVKKELARLRNFAVELTPFKPDATESLLNGLFSKARSLAEGFFGVDFAEEALTDLSSWDTLRGHDALKKNMIPLPLNNTVIGKQMRTAAFLAIMAAELHRYIFQPAYVIEEADELCEVLSDLAKEATEQEAYVRSVLLAAFRGKQAHEALHRRLERTTDTIFSFVGGFFNSTVKNTLRSSLAELCRDSCNEWQRIQLLKEKIEPRFDFIHDPDEWRPLIFRMPGLVSPPTPAAAKAQQQNGSVPPNATNKRSGKQGQQQAAKPPPEEEAGPDLANSVIWPSFWVASLIQYDDETALARGYVLCESQIIAAKEEEKMQVFPSTRRAARRDVRRLRTMSTGAMGQVGMGPPSSSGGEVSVVGTGPAAPPGGGAAAPGAANANGASFLSGKGGGGQKSG
ncbi:hypothetical protein B0T25DRAFT_554841 [Lasiosphaeria hispida]|uniref:MEI5 protein n=1 Tax=Lasiosphaeria hispida TaxID=260671 RepID=A0AAJ0H8A2_9PEZI|nr:hypothetical protein B0T25DRAFT_554841 [Lasiosphaeria hispida]